ncbi:MAG: deoxyribonuclease IV [bacterium]|nr:MAG: deoxyribonuclease IV [bacterium]
MIFGAHESITGGFHEAVARAVEDGCEAVQIFTGPPARWTIPSIEREAAEIFRLVLEASGLGSVLAHGPYLINPASPDPDLWIRSKVALGEECRRCRTLGIRQVIIHPGSHRGTSIGDGVRRAAEMIGQVLEENPEGPGLLLENTAGSGSSIGGSFSHLAAIRELAGNPERVHYCFDTAHAFAAGYDLRDSTAVNNTLRRVDGEVGMGNVLAVHLNDSGKELGSRVDRHQRIGKGFIGLKGFGALLSREELSGVPGILETQPLPEDEGRYRPELRLLKKLRGTGK